MAHYVRKNDVTTQVGTKLPSAYPATKVTIDKTGTNYTSDDVDGVLREIDSALTANTFGSSINITSYTSTAYTFPSDGYLQLRNGETVNDTIIALINNALSISAKTHEANRNEYNALFVKKGMTCKINTNTGSRGTAFFFPFA